MNIKDFLIDNYIWTIIVVLLTIVTIIGFLADKQKNSKKENTSKEISKDNDTAVTNKSNVEQVQMNNNNLNQNPTINPNPVQNNNNIGNNSKMFSFPGTVNNQNIGQSVFAATNENMVNNNNVARVDNGMNSSVTPQVMPNTQVSPAVAPIPQNTVYTPVAEPQNTVYTPVTEPTPIVTQEPVPAYNETYSQTIPQPVETIAMTPNVNPNMQQVNQYNMPQQEYVVNTPNVNQVPNQNINVVPNNQNTIPTPMNANQHNYFNVQPNIGHNNGTVPTTISATLVEPPKPITPQPIMPPQGVIVNSNNNPNLNVPNQQMNPIGYNHQNNLIMPTSEQGINFVYGPQNPNNKA